MAQIKFVYFDIEDVTFEWRQVLRKIGVMANKSYEEVLAVFKKYDDDVCRGKIMPQKLWEYFKEELQIEHEDFENFLEWWSNSFTPIPAMHKVVEEASEKYRVGIATNIYPGALKYYVADKLIPDISYNTIIQSCDIGFIKPEAEFYKYAQDKTGVYPQEILLVDNSKENIDKAKELGWQVGWYDVTNPRESIVNIRQILGL
jgi:HAD superfamily hydrolase (TIGR01509 family)